MSTAKTEVSPSETEVHALVADAGADGVDPQKLIAALVGKAYSKASVIEAIQHAIEHSKIYLNGEGMVVSTNRPVARAA